MDTIWKFKLALADRQMISLPHEFRILHVGVDPMGLICLWAAVKKGSAKRDVEIIIVGTGNPLPHVGSFLGTVKFTPFMWHVFTGPGDANGYSDDLHYLTKGNG